ncbi:hypothetical protein EDB84DRAFT_1565261 [Lactarius hengduanensis]|nr:hypothetical protein EDB84DRAFT_1565261 [Lactarius hengduanensis]
MEDEIPRPRPRRVNANTHPGKIVNDLKQKRRTTAEKVADDKAKASKEKEETTKAKKSRQAEVAQVAEVEDALRREDRAYPNIVSEGDTDSDTHKLRASDDKSEVDHPEAEVPEDTASNTKSQSESNLDGDVHMSEPEDPEGHKIVVRERAMTTTVTTSTKMTHEEDPDTDKEESEGSDSGLEELEEEIVARKMEKKGKKNAKEALIKKKKAPTPAKSGLREEITQVRKTSAVSGQKRKPGPEPVKDSSDESEDEEERTKRLREQILRDRLTERPDFDSHPAPDPDHFGCQRRPIPIKTVLSDIGMVTHAKHERWAGWRCTRSLASGTFDDDEDPRSLQAARAAKKAKAVEIGSSTPNWVAAIRELYQQSHICGGPVVKKKDINTAGLTRGPVVKSEGNELSKPYRLLKASESQSQENTKTRNGIASFALWDKCLPERTENVRVNPAIKKVVIDRLNEWRSTIGKKAVAVINDLSSTMPR